jgi:hypothetical protein
MSTRLSNNARWMLTGLSLTFVLLLYPPFWHGDQLGRGQRRWHFILETRGQRGHVDLPMLVLEFLVVGVGGGTAWYLTTLQDQYSPRPNVRKSPVGPASTGGQDKLGNYPVVQYFKVRLKLPALFSYLRRCH